MDVGLVVHAGRQPSVDVAARAARHLIDHGVGVVAAQDSHEDGDACDLSALRELAPPAPLATFVDGLDLVISFGGDGTFLRAAHLCRDADVPLLGVNLGRLGFLAEIEVDGLEPALDVLVAGEFDVELRPTLDVHIQDPDGGHLAQGWALNEVSIEKTVRQRVLSMEVHVDGTLFEHLSADALVVATPTGSTAYALSAGGPIVSPRLDATLVVPVAPHSLFDRTTMVGPDEAIRIELAAGQPPGLVSCDGREPVRLAPGGAVHARGGGRPVRIARTQRPDFYSLVREKFGLR